MESFDAYIQAFQIFKKYTKDVSPLSAEHDVIYCIIDPAAVSPEDIAMLESLKWYALDGGGDFYHYT